MHALDLGLGDGVVVVGGGAKGGGVLGDDFAERHAQRLPGEDLDVLLNVAGLGLREAHDELEKVLGRRLLLGHSQRVVALQVAPDAVLLFNGELAVDQLLQQVDGVHAGDDALALLVPVDARHARHAGLVVLKRQRHKLHLDDRVLLDALELHQPAPLGPLLVAPVAAHVSDFALNVQLGSCRHMRRRRCRGLHVALVRLLARVAHVRDLGVVLKLVVRVVVHWWRGWRLSRGACSYHRGRAMGRPGRGRGGGHRGRVAGPEKAGSVVVVVA